MILVDKHKRCSYCKKEKSKESFSKNCSTLDGLRNRCKDCDREYRMINKEKIKIINKRWINNNKAKSNEIARNWHKRNKKTSNLRSKKYRDNNREKFNEISRLSWAKHGKGYYLNNRDKFSLWRRTARYKRKVRVEDTKNLVTTKEINNLIKDSNNICFWCDCDIPKGDLHIDHIYPLSKNGEHTISNLCVSCKTCNLRKNAKDPETWLNEILKAKFHNLIDDFRV